jgi:hypothetical protein
LRVSRGLSNRPVDFTAAFLRLIDLDEVRVWRMPRRDRALCVAMAVTMLGLTCYAAYWAVRDGGRASIALLAAFVLIDIVVGHMVWYAFAAVTVAEPDGVRVGRGRRAVRVPWPAIEACRAGDRGTTIACSDGAEVLAAAPQHANVKRGRHSKTEADYAALYIAERARMYRLAHPEDSVQPEDQGRPEDKGHPEDKGRSEDKGGLEDQGQPEDLSRQER